MVVDQFQAKGEIQQQLFHSHSDGVAPWDLCEPAVEIAALILEFMIP